MPSVARSNPTLSPVAFARLAAPSWYGLGCCSRTRVKLRRTSTFCFKAYAGWWRSSQEPEPTKRSESQHLLCCPTPQEQHAYIPWVFSTNFLSVLLFELHSTLNNRLQVPKIAAYAFPVSIQAFVHRCCSANLIGVHSFFCTYESVHEQSWLLKLRRTRALQITWQRI